MGNAYKLVTPWTISVPNNGLPICNSLQLISYLSACYICRESLGEFPAVRAYTPKLDDVMLICGAALRTCTGIAKEKSEKSGFSYYHNIQLDSLNSIRYESWICNTLPNFSNLSSSIQKTKTHPAKVSKIQLTDIYGNYCVSAIPLFT
jgi:uncharacterized CHY-type Zn-finger protein